VKRSETSALLLARGWMRSHPAAGLSKWCGVGFEGRRAKRRSAGREKNPGWALWQMRVNTPGGRPSGEGGKRQGVILTESAGEVDGGRSKSASPNESRESPGGQASRARRSGRRAGGQQGQSTASRGVTTVSSTEHRGKAVVTRRRISRVDFFFFFWFVCWAVRAR